MAQNRAKTSCRTLPNFSLDENLRLFKISPKPQIASLFWCATFAWKAVGEKRLAVPVHSLDIAQSSQQVEYTMTYCNFCVMPGPASLKQPLDGQAQKTPDQPGCFRSGR